MITERAPLNVEAEVNLILSLLLTHIILFLYILFSHIYNEFVPPVFPDHLLV